MKQCFPFYHTFLGTFILYGFITEFLWSNDCYNQVRCNSCYDKAGCNSCYDKAVLDSCYNKAGRSSYYDEAGHIGILLRILRPPYWAGPYELSLASPLTPPILDDVQNFVFLFFGFPNSLYTFPLSHAYFFVT